MRIVSLLPSATEIVFALGLGDQVVAVTHECDYPSEALGLPKLTANALATEGMSEAEIDTAVRDSLHKGASIYHLDEQELARLKPDLILTQEMCPVCAVSYTEVMKAVRVMDASPKVISLEPHSVADVLTTIDAVAAAAGVPYNGSSLVSSLTVRIAILRAFATRTEERPRVLCLEWTNPPIAGGHWIPEMVETVGGTNVLGSPEESKRVSWDEVLASHPDIVVLMPCGFDAPRALAEYRRTALPKGWHDLAAVQSGRVYAVDASAYFARPGPRIVDGMQLLAGIVHPELFSPSPLAAKAVIRATL